MDPSLGIDTGISLQEGAAGQTLDGQLPVNVGSDRLVSLNFEGNPARPGWSHQRRQADQLSGQWQPSPCWMRGARRC
ncbi:hypothetical protein [Aeromonas ichthyocola]